MESIYLPKLKENDIGLSPAVINYYMEATACALSIHGHHSGIELKVFGTVNTKFSLVWENELNTNIINSYKNYYKTTIIASRAISILLLDKLNHIQNLERIPTSKFADYRFILNKKPPHHFLKVTGIWSEKAGNNLRNRLNKKINKIPVSNLKNHSFIGIELSSPKARILQF